MFRFLEVVREVVDREEVDREVVELVPRVLEEAEELDREELPVPLDLR